MDPRTSTSKLAQRVVKTVTVTALSLGLAATLLAPNAAVAAPAHELTTSARSDLVPFIVDFNSWHPGQFREIGIAIMNKGNAHADNVEVVIQAGTGFTHAAAKGSGWTCTQTMRYPYPHGPAYTTCRTPLIARDSHKAIAFTAHAREIGPRTIEVRVDPQNKEPELDGTNNVAKANYSS